MGKHLMLTTSLAYRFSGVQVECSLKVGCSLSVACCLDLSKMLLLTVQTLQLALLVFVQLEVGLKVGRRRGGIHVDWASHRQGTTPRVRAGRGRHRHRAKVVVVAGRRDDGSWDGGSWGLQVRSRQRRGGVSDVSWSGSWGWSVSGRGRGRGRGLDGTLDQVGERSEDDAGDVVQVDGPGGHDVDQVQDGEDERGEEEPDGARLREAVERGGAGGDDVGDGVGAKGEQLVVAELGLHVGDEAAQDAHREEGEVEGAHVAHGALLVGGDGHVVGTGWMGCVGFGMGYVVTLKPAIYGHELETSDL